MKVRLEYYDILRGGGILAVIAIHTTGNMDDLYHTSQMSFHLAVIWRQIVGFAVPLFLAISGYFLSKKSVHDKDSYTSFLSKQIPRVYIPMLVWSLPLLALNLFFKDTNITNSLILFSIGGFSVYYFIALIMQYYLLLPFLQRIANKKGLIVSTIISFISLAIFFYLTKIKLLSIPLILYAGPFPVWLMFFALGLYLGRNKILTSKMILFVFVLIGLFISIAETYYIFNFTDSFQGLGIKIGAFIYSFAIILLLFSLEYEPKKKNIFWRLMAYIGRISFGIYLIHIYILSYIVRIAANEMVFSSYLLEQLFSIFVTALISIVVISGARAINKSLAVKYLGF